MRILLQEFFCKNMLTNLFLFLAFKKPTMFCYPLQLPVASSSFFQSSEVQPVGLFSLSTEHTFQSRTERPLRVFSLSQAYPTHSPA